MAATATSYPRIRAEGGVEMENMMVRSVAVLVVTTSGLAFSYDVDAHKLKQEQQCMALALYWEARGEGRLGMMAVGWTILNRAFNVDFPSTPCEVVYQGGEQAPCQFSWYCDGKSDRPRDWHSWQHAMQIAAELLSRPPDDPTGGALFFHSTSINSRWHRKRLRLARIGSHIFYR